MVWGNVSYWVFIHLFSCKKTDKRAGSCIRKNKGRNRTRVLSLRQSHTIWSNWCGFGRAYWLCDLFNLPYYMKHPIEIFETWHGGMSFHGGLTGAVLACAIYCKRHDLNPWLWGDRFVVTAPIGLGCGRIGNFINGELYGRPTNVPWAMIFPAGGPIPRHPSQLYEAFLEGVLLFLILWPLRNKNWPTGRKVALFLMLYGVVRIFAEFFREPDPQLGFILWGWVTMGQILSLVVFIIGVLLWFYRKDGDRLFENKA